VTIVTMPAGVKRGCRFRMPGARPGKFLQMSVTQPLLAERYRLVRSLGQGGMGRVWLARDEVLHRDVAIKEVIPPAGLTAEERDEMRRRTLREARAAARLNHPSVVRVYDVVRTDVHPWIVMEYVPSRSLHEVLAEDGPLPATQVAQIGLQVLGALRAAHRAGVLHRDVKPSNVLLTDDGRVVLTDFGLATMPGEATVTRPGMVLGSPAYIAPERAREGHAGPESDLWSLGATLYAGVEGSSPYQRSSAIATLTALVTEEPPLARRAGPLRPVLAGLLRKDPTTRINAEEAERLLRRAAGGGIASRLWLVPRPRIGVPRSSPATPLPSTGTPGSVPGTRVAGRASAAGSVAGSAAGAAGSAGPAAGSVARSSAGATSAAGSAAAEAKAAPPVEPPAVVPAAAAVTSVISQSEVDATDLIKPASAPVEPPAEVAPVELVTTEPERAAVELQPAAEVAAAEVAAAEVAAAEVAVAEEPAAAESAVAAPPAESSAPPAKPPAEATATLSSPAAASPTGPMTRTADGTTRVAHPEPEADTAPRRLPLAGWGPRAGTLVRAVPERFRAIPRRWLAVGVVVLALLIVTLALLPSGGDKKKAHTAPAPTGASTSARPAAPAVPSAAATSATAETPSQAPPAGPPPLPEGWQMYTDETGFSLAVPIGWNVSRDGTILYFREPGGGRILGIDQSSQPNMDPVADWTNQERQRAGSFYHGYQRIRIDPVRYFIACADWEFTYDQGGTRAHVINRGFVTSDHQAYGIWWSTPDNVWQGNLKYFDLITSTFKPRP
jgi:eukaryotic-like serine/threonine-protein kinase